jgi:hypothetical protein
VTSGKGKGDVKSWTPQGYLHNPDGSLRTFTREAALKLKSRGADEIPRACREAWNSKLQPFAGIPASIAGPQKKAHTLSRLAASIRSHGFAEDIVEAMAEAAWNRSQLGSKKAGITE